MVEYGSSHDKFFLFRHEWLHDEQSARQGLEQVFAAVNLPLDEVCLRVVMQKNVHPTKFRGESTEMARDRKMRSERWRLWTEEQRETFANLCGTAMRKLGYPIPWQAD
jgi:hypothetical protein